MGSTWLFRVLPGLLLAAPPLHAGGHSGSAAEGPPDFRCDDQPEGAYEPVTIRNRARTLEATFIPYGGTLTHLVFGGEGGVDVVLGWEDPRQYCVSKQHSYFGATIGRVSNRIANGSFMFNGQTYHTPLNEKGTNTLHGGWFGFDRQVFQVVERSADSVTFEYLSPEGEEGFPGALSARVTHTITDNNEWQLRYSAQADRDTVVALTSHPYFNLNGNINNTATVLEHVVSVPSGGHFIEVDQEMIPTGHVKPVADAPALDFRKPKQLGRDIDEGTATPLGGYDNALVLDGWEPGVRPEDSPVAITVSTPLTGIGLRVRTDQPSLQIYSGNTLNGTDPSQRIPRKRSQSFGPIPQYYQWRGALVIEAQHYPDSVNHPQFPSVVLRKGQEYSQFTSYQFFYTAEAFVI